MSSEPEFARQSRSKLWIILFGVAALLPLGLGLLWYYGVTTLDSDLAALRATGLPATARELNEFYVVPAGVPDTTEVWVRAILAVQAAKLSERGSTLPLIGSGPSPIPVPGQPWAELEATRKLLGECGAELQAIRAAAAAGGQARFPIDLSAGIHTLLPLTQESRQVARVLALDAWVSAHDGNGTRTLEDVKGIFALSDALRGEPLLISQLVRIAVYAVGCETVARLMPHCAWSDADLQSLQSVAQAARFKEEMARAYMGERATCLTALDDMPLGPLRQANAREMVRLFQSSIDSFSGPWVEIIARQEELNDEVMKIQNGMINRMRMAGVVTLLPALRQASVAGARGETRQKCLIAAIAAERYRLQHHRYPESLAEIKSLLANGPTAEAVDMLDPFDGRPLRYKVEKQRLVIYSVGDDKKDDGGDVDRDEQPSGNVPRAPLDIGIAIKRRE